VVPKSLNPPSLAILWGLGIKEAPSSFTRRPGGDSCGFVCDWVIRSWNRRVRLKKIEKMKTLGSSSEEGGPGWGQG